MCDQTEVSYLENDVVWVKIGSVWWPGVVKDLEKEDEGKEILARLKKKPIAVVKFFQEDYYEFVKNLDCIYHYSCRKKDEFIKKGLDKFRTGASHMKKFPADVTTAESLTNGDVNIINDPKFLPEKKESYSEIFGSGKKKTKKNSDLTTPRSKVRTSTNVTPYRPITHQRFINKVLHGESDHRVKTLIQSNSSAEESASRSPYKCHICKFETSRVNVIVAHHRLSHSSENSINWTGSDSKLIRKKSIHKSRKLKSKKLFDESRDSFAVDELSEAKSKSKTEETKSPEKTESGSTSPSKRKIAEASSSPDGNDSKKPRFTDVLLADWNEDDEEDNEKKEPGDDKIIGESQKKSRTEGDGESKTGNASASLESVDNSNSPPAAAEKTAKKSCFDFDEEDEGFIGMSNANTYGRKIPRVIPVKDKAELGMDLEIDELFKKKSDSESEKEDVDREDKNEGGEKDKKANEATPVAETAGDEENATIREEKSTSVAGTSKRRKGKANKEEESKVKPENSLASRKTKRIGAKKCYSNEVIEKIEEDVSKAESIERRESTETVSEGVKMEGNSSSSRRKQDFKNQPVDSEHREEMVYSDIVNSELKQKSGDGGENKKDKSQTSRIDINDDFTAQIDELLEETKPAAILESASSKIEKSDEIKSASTTNFSFDYMPAEPAAVKKTAKTRTEVKSISRMFGDSISGSETASDGDCQGGVQAEPANGLPRNELATPQSDSGQGGKSVSGANFSLKRGSIVLSSMAKTASESPSKVISAGVRQTNPSKECIVIPAEKKCDAKEVEDSSEVTEPTERLANIKTIKVKPDSPLPPSLISTRKLKGQTIIHQKSGKYVIVTQPPQLGRQRATPEKVQSGSKVVIFTNQHGEQKIITTSGLQQTKFKVDGQKIVSASAASDSAEDKGSLSSPSTTQSPAQPVIKMVPDGKGGIMKQLRVSPKKVLLGGTTKVYVSASGSNLSAGNNVQKIALASGGRSGGGDYRLIENYKGSGKMVLVQGGAGSGSGSSVVLKSSSVVPRQVTKVIQNQQIVPGGLKKKPKILMRTSTGQGVGEYVMQSASAGTAESPAIVVKQKGTDGKFSTQKILKTEVASPGKVTAASAAGAKRFFLSGQTSNKKGESFIIATNEGTVQASKVIRMRQKIKEVDPGAASPTKSTQKTVPTKSPEMYGGSQNSLLLPQQSSAETETQRQIVQIQEPPQQPAILQTQVIAMPGPVSVDGNQTYVLVSVDEHGVVQGMDNSVVAAYDAAAAAAAAGQQDPQIFVNSTSAANNVILLNPQTNDQATPVFSTSSQDILAEALANTNVLEGTINNEMDTVVPSILLPPSIPSSVVQETSITLQKPIMTPLEMPSSVAPEPGTCLEPPPLPPTPTNEDVLMEEEEEEEDESSKVTADKTEVETNSRDDIETYLRPRQITGSDDESSRFRATDFAKEPGSEKTFEKTETEEVNNGEESRRERDLLEESELPNAEENEGKESSEGLAPREDYVIENSQEGVEEESTTNSLQSMPILNDEPDTSDDAQGSEPIADQQFESQKSRLNSDELSRLIREQEKQEPPSSTIRRNRKNSVASEGFDESDFGQGGREGDTGAGENESENKESTDAGPEKGDEKHGEKESLGVEEKHSMDPIADETGFEDAISHKKMFQEETEVSSTTLDEYARKSVATN